MDVAINLGEADHPIRLQGGVKDASYPMYQLQIGSRDVPTVKQYSACLQARVRNCGDQHSATMVMLGLAVSIGRVDAVVNGIKVARDTVRMHQMNDADTSNNVVPSSHACLLLACRPAPRRDGRDRVAALATIVALLALHDEKRAIAANATSQK